MTSRGTGDGTHTVLLLSGGIDSAALASWLRPTWTLFIDYGQRPAEAEGRAAGAVARELGLDFSTVTIDLSCLGGGLLADEEVPASWPSPEWWPFRNQILVTFAAAWALKRHPDLATGASPMQLLTGTVASDGARHQDGTPGFYADLAALMSRQEGEVRVSAPAIGLTTLELIEKSEVTDEVLGWTHSCHRADLPCGSCPGCYKRDEVLQALGRLS